MLFKSRLCAEVLTDLEGRLPKAWQEILPQQLALAFDLRRNRSWAEWSELLEDLPKLSASQVDFMGDVISIGAESDCDERTRDRIRTALQRLHPWRKGPFRVHGIEIDAEWRSDQKWRRLAGQLQPLRGRRVLDVGCGNGYYAWRMLGLGAERVLGIDPILLNVVQFLAIKHFAGHWPIHVLPVGIEDLPPHCEHFDTVFSMGVLHHRRSPIDHLLELRNCLRPRGELVLETLVIEGGIGDVLVPEDRYQRMRNVWFLPSPSALLSWLKRCGFRNVRVVDVHRTGAEEQRSTPWMTFQSLTDFLDPLNPDLTCEGLPAPRRAILLAEKS